jgi:hypothetical protein
MNFLQNLHRSDLVKASQVVMLRLYTADGSGATHAVGMALDQLEKLGIVERRIHARDMRVSSSYLTADGRAKTENMLNAMVAYVDDIKKRERRAHP